jgi:CRP-like cAMP-binding protein
MSESPAEPVLRIPPVVVGAAHGDRIIVRREDAPAYLCLSRAELAALTELQRAPTSVSNFLAKHLSGSGEMDFKAAVNLVMRLHQAGFILDTTDEITARLREYAGRSPTRVSGQLAKVASHAAAAVDLELIAFDRSKVHPVMRSVGAALVSPAGVTALVAAVVGLFVYTGLGGLPSAPLADLLARPESLLATAFLAISAAASFVGVLSAAALAGAGARFTAGALRLTAFCCVRFVVDDRDALALPRGAMLRYHAVTLLVPWLCALVWWHVAGADGFASLSGQLATAFGLVAVLGVCPLVRGPLIKSIEGLLATLNIRERANAYLTTGLFGPLMRGAAPAADLGDRSLQLAIPLLAGLALLWLYVLGLGFADALLAAVPDLVAQATARSNLPRAAAACLVLAALGLAVVAPLARLALIPFQNLAAIAAVPLTRARRGVGAYYDRKLPASAAISAFLREVPVFADLSDEQLAALSEALGFRAYGPGQPMIVKGDVGDEFFVLADGQAQVVVGGNGAPEEVIEVLSPGDSFGEIALVENVRRTATVRAMTPAKTLVLSRTAFDRIFPAGSEVRGRLTGIIRQVKLVLESKALSHLSPRQVRELLRSAKSVRFAAGEFLIRENTDGDAAFLVESGEVQVVRESAAVEVAVLGRGELVGAIALLKDVQRTASVRAKSDVLALQIDKATFLRMCMSNMFVALLVADLADRQAAETARLAGSQQSSTSATGTRPAPRAG